MNFVKFLRPQFFKEHLRWLFLTLQSIYNNYSHWLLFVFIGFTTHCHLLSFVVTNFHSVSFVVRLVVTRCHSLYHSLSLDVPLVCFLLTILIDRKYLIFSSLEIQRRFIHTKVSRRI